MLDVDKDVRTARTMEELRSGSQRQVILKALEGFLQMAAKGLGYSGTVVAR